MISSQRLMLLRSVEAHLYIVGVCDLHGVTNLEPLFGPLPDGHSMELVGSSEDPWNMRFVRERLTGITSLRDPHLEITYPEWKSSERADVRSIIYEPLGTSALSKSDLRHTNVVLQETMG